jgi:transcription initiation factor TFIIIB Brf1 subunit/transcription initiation factor TFIIB
MNNKSKKNRNASVSRVELWKLLENEMNNITNEPIELTCGLSGNKELCQKCKSILAFSDEGFLVCTNGECGIIYKDIVDQSAEWRYYGADDKQSSDPTRCGMPINPLLEESSYGCKVLINGPMSYEMRKIRRFTEWQSMPYKEKSQYDEFKKITTMANNAGIPKMIIDDAIKYHKKISDFDLTFRGDNRDGILCASIYISCIINKFPRTPTEIALMFNLDVTTATKGCKNAISIINDLEKDMDNKDKTKFCITTSKSFIDRYCSKLNINPELTKLCNFISSKIEHNNSMPENTPPSIAAGIVYFVSQICKLNITKLSVKSVSEISEVTINKCYKKLEQLQDELIPPKIIIKYTIKK